MAESLGRYTIVEPIGEGGLGPAYRAVDTSLGRTVTIKIVPEAVAGDAARRERLLHDAQQAAELSHPSVAGLIETGEANGRLFLVFEHVQGDRLRATMAGRPMNVRRAVDFAIQLADALAEGHGRGILHRDLKPDNVIITPKGRPKLLDFGFASWTRGGGLRETAAARPSEDGGAIDEAIAYMSPEQALGERVDDRTDVFSLGVLLFEMLTGRSPFAAPTASATLVQILQATPPAPSTLNREVPPALDRIVARALSKSLDGRYPGAAMVATELRGVSSALEAESEAGELGLPDEAGRRRRRRGWVLAALMLVAALLVGLVWAWRVEARMFIRRWTGPHPAPVVMVAPFEARASSTSARAFADGFADDLAARLGQIPGILVLGRSSTRSLRNTDAAASARKIGAEVVLAGAVEVEGDQVRVEARLVDLAGEQIWRRRYAGDVRGILRIQVEAAEASAEALRVPAGESPGRQRARVRQVNRAAYELYLQGRDAWARGNADGAVAFYEQAVASQEDLAEANAALAIALAGRTRGIGGSDSTVDARIERAAANAATADPDLPDAEIALAFAAEDLGEALGHLRRAIDLDRSNALAYHAIGDLVAGSDPQRALLCYERSIALDPGIEENYADRAVTYGSLARFDDAVRELNRGRAVAPASVAWRVLLARISFERGQYKTALGWATDPAVRTTLPAAARYVAALEAEGQHAAAEEGAREMIARFRSACSPPAYLIALQHDRGRRAEAVAAARKMVQAVETADVRAAPWGCAALAAAAVEDAEGAAFWLSRIAASERALGAWGREAGEAAPEIAVRSGWYPWRKIASRPQVLEAGQAIERARAAIRRRIAEALRGLPPDPPASASAK
jgi:TolB-like protein